MNNQSYSYDGSDKMLGLASIGTGALGLIIISIILGTNSISSIFADVGTLIFFVIAMISVVVGIVLSVISMVIGAKNKICSASMIGIAVSLVTVFWFVGCLFDLSSSNFKDLLYYFVVSVVTSIAPILAIHLLQFQSVALKIVVMIFSVVSAFILLFTQGIVGMMSLMKIPQYTFYLVLCAITFMNYITIFSELRKFGYFNYDGHELHIIGKDHWAMNLTVYIAETVLFLFVALFADKDFIFVLIYPVVGAILSVIFRDSAKLMPLNAIFTVIIDLAILREFDISGNLLMSMDLFLLKCFAVLGAISFVTTIYGMSCMDINKNNIVSNPET